MKRLALFVFLIIVFTFLFIPQEVSAHATPINYEPEASTVLEKVPEKVRIYFTESIEPKTSSITIFGPDGSRVDKNDAAVDASNPHYYSTGLEDRGEGTYTVSWQVVSVEDGHFTKGAFVFSVGKEKGSAEAVDASQFKVTYSSTLTEGLTIWVELLGQSILLGCLVLNVFLWRPMLSFDKKLSSYNKSFERRFTLLILTGVFLVVIGTISYLILKSIDLQQMQNNSFLNAFQIFLATFSGKFTLYRTILTATFLSVFFSTRKTIFKSERLSRSEILLLILVLFMALARARVSHAAASHFLPEFSVFANFVHLIFKELWVGGLISMALLFLPILSKVRDGLTTAFSLTSFSKLISISIGFFGITGAYISWLHLKDLSNILTTDWGVKFVVFNIFIFIFFSMRLYNQLIVEKISIEVLKGKKDNRSKKYLLWFSYSFPFETIAGIAVLLITSFLIITTPPLIQDNLFEKSAISQGAQITLSEHPSDTDKLLINIRDRNKMEIPIKNIVITLFNEEKNIGPIVAETEKRFEGGYVFPKSYFSPAGQWKLDINAIRPDAYDATATFLIDYPAEIERSHISGDKRDFGLFETIVALSVFSIIVLSYLLYRFSRNLNRVCVSLQK